jgi:hypothetical protein
MHWKPAKAVKVRGAGGKEEAGEVIKLPKTKVVK